jgi:hypothetical protein
MEAEMTDEELVKQARVSIDYTDPEVIARQNIPPNAGCVIDGTFYDVRNLVHLASSQADQIEALEQQVSDLLADVPCACGYDSPTDVCMKHLPLVRNLTAKLAKAMEALREIAGECGCSTARAIIAEIEGEQP